ncbi:hypothetical protein KUTeg_022234 [Tegillarca granosa]|uniref:Uncharacterized protein n=1 Tax=Tegillarca granosa TaxID=220873 RepID=A0ABQ9EB29_TEGGR|nr:hypothetical protein KUTeg_022234 [Tegillarca granosa]
MTYSVQQNLLQSQISLGSQQVVQQLPSGSNLAIQQLPTRLQLAVQQFPTGSQPAVQQLQTRLQLAVQQLPTGSQPAVQQFPTGSQPAVQQFTTASQPAVQQLPTVSQLAVQQLPSGSQSAVQQFQTGSQPALQQLPTGSQPAVQQFQTGSQPAVQQFPTGSQLAVQQLPTVSQLAVQQFQTGSQPALQQFPPGSQLAVQQLPTVSQLAIQQLPTSSQLSFPQAASGSQINMQDVATGMQIALPQANIDSQLLLPQTATGSQMALSQGSVGQQIAMPQGSMVSQIVLPQVSTGSQLALPQDNIGQHIALSHTASDSQLNISQGNIVPQIILPQDNISSQLPLQQVTTSKQNTTPTKIQVTQLNSSQLTYMPPVAIASMPQVIDGPNLPIQSLESQITIQNSSDGSQMTLNSSQDKTKSSQDLSQKGPYQKGITSTSQSQPSGVVLQPFTLARNVLENQHSGGEDLQIMSTDQHSNNVSADQTDKSITVPWNQTVLESQQSNISKLQNSPHHQQQISPAARSEILENVSNSTQQINTIFGKKNQQISSSVLNISGKLPQNENIGHKTMLEAQSIDKQMSSTVDSLQFRSKMFSGIQGSQTNCSSTNTVSVLGMNQRPIPSHVTSQQQVNQNFSSQVNSQQPVNQSFSSQINSQQPVNQSFSSQVNSQQPVNQNFSSQVNLQQPVNQSFSSHATSQQPVNKSFSSQVNVQQPVNQSFTSQVNSQQLVNQSFSSHATSQQLVNQSLSSAAAIQLPVNRSMFNYTTSQQQGVSIHASDQQPITPTPSASVRQQMNGQKSSLHGNILNKDLSNQITPVSYVSNQNTFSSSLSNPDVANLASQMNQSTFTQTEHTRTLQKSTETSQLNKFNNNNMDTSESLLHPKVQNTSDVLLRTHDKILPSVNVNVLNYLSQEQKSFKASANSAFQVRNANNQTLQSKKPIQTLKSDHLKEQTRDGIKEQGQGQTNTTGSNQNHSEVQDDSVNQNQNRQYLQQNMSLSLNNNAAFQILNQMQKGSVVTHEQVNNEGHNTNKHVLNNDKVVVPVRFVETLNNGSALDPTQIASRVQNSQLNTTKVNTETSQNVTLEYCHPPLSKLLSTSNGNHHKEHDQQNTTYVTKVGQKNKENKSQVVPGLTHMTKIVEQQSSKVITHMTKIVEQQSSKVMDSSSGVNPVAQILNVKSQNGGTVSVSRCGQIQEHSSSPESGIVADKQNTSNILVENENNTSSVTLNRNNTQMNTQQDYSHQKYINCSPSISNQQPVRTSQLKITQPTILNSTGDSIVRQIPQQHVVMQSSNIVAPSSDIVNQQPSVPIQTQMVAPTQIVLTPTGDSVSGQQRLLQLNIQLQTNSPQEVANILQLLQNSDLTSQLPLSTSHAAVNFSPVPPTQSGNQRVPCVMESSATTMFTSTLGETSKVMIQPMIEPSSTAISSETSISVPKQVSMAIINKSAVQNINDVSSVSTLGSVNMTTQTCNQMGHQVAKDISVTSLANPLVSTSLPAFLPNKYVSKEMFHHSQGSPFASVQQSKVSVYPMKVIDKVQVQDKNEECSTNIRSDQMQRINFNSKEHQQQNKLGNNEGCTPEVQQNKIGNNEGCTPELQQNKIGNNEGCTPEVQQNKIGNNEGCTPEIVSVNQRSKQTTRGQSKTRTQHQYNQSHVTQNQGQGYTVYRQVQGQNECQGQITKLGQGYTVQKQSLVDNIEGQNKDQSKIMQGSVYREDEVDNIQRHITNIQATKEAGPLQNPNIVQGIIQGQHIKNSLPVNCTLVLKHKSNDDFQSNEGS